MTDDLNPALASPRQSFENVIEKAKTACTLSEQNVEDHFADIGKMIQVGKGANKSILHDCSEGVFQVIFELFVVQNAVL